MSNPFSKTDDSSFTTDERVRRIERMVFEILYKNRNQAVPNYPFVIWDAITRDIIAERK